MTKDEARHKLRKEGYNVVDDKPEWWDTAAHKNVNLAGDISKLIKEG